MLYNTTPDQLYEPRAAVDPIGFGRVAIVTGCASGIGLACTQLLLAHQFSVCGIDRNPFDYATLLREADHGRFHFHCCDLAANPAACDNAVRVCQQSLLCGRPSRIDVLVNVAGVLDNFASADAVSDRLWDECLAVNLTVPVRMMRAVLPFMRLSGPGMGFDAGSSASTSAFKSTGTGTSPRERTSPDPASASSGVIINVASTAGISGAVAGIAYTASKHGLIGATKNVAWRFRNEGIRCNAVLPGAVDSSIGQAISSRMDVGLDTDAFAELAPVHALQARSSSQTITPLEVAKAVLFLIGNEARSINGVCLPVDRAWGVM